MNRRLLRDFNFLPVVASFEVAASSKRFFVFIATFLLIDGRDGLHGILISIAFSAYFGCPVIGRQWEGGCSGMIFLGAVKMASASGRNGLDMRKRKRVACAKAIRQGRK